MGYTSHPLMDIRDSLVVPANPPRDDGNLDWERCAKLHNFLVALGWMAAMGKETDDLDELMQPDKFNWFQVHHRENMWSNAYRDHSSMDRQLVDFLEAIIVPVGRDHPFFFHWVAGMPTPAEIHDHYIIQHFDDYTKQDKSAITLLYTMTLDMSREGVGIVYNRNIRKVAFVPTIYHSDLVTPASEHPERWFPLEFLLTHWIKLHVHEKITIGPPKSVRHRIHDVWRMQPYCSFQVENTIAAFERLVIAIDSRLPSEPRLPTVRKKYLLNNDDLDAAGAPEKCFVREFLTGAPVPRFKYIAPGLVVPHDRWAFITQQRFTRLAYEQNPEDGRIVIPPLLIFADKDGGTVDFSGGYKGYNPNPFPKEMHLEPSDQSTPAGLYSESVVLDSSDMAEEGFRLLMPFQFDSSYTGARLSDGALLPVGSVADLFQHGDFALGGMARAQRMERLFDWWRHLVEEGIWTVGDDGVEGTMDTFRDADRGKWKDYMIPLDTEV